MKKFDIEIKTIQEATKEMMKTFVPKQTKKIKELNKKLENKNDERTNG